jgi:hypothetical protein
MTASPAESRCWITTPCAGWQGPDFYVGYVWAVDLTQAKRIAIQSEPDGCCDFLDFRFRRRPDLDGICPHETAAWEPSELPKSLRHRAAELWTGLETEP